MIECSGLNKTFGKVQALRNVNITFSGGSGIALIGPNGSGKTTLLKCLLGLVIPDSGAITINGKNILNEHHYRSDIGYMPQISRYPPNLSIASLFDMLRQLRADEKRNDDDLIKAYQLDEFGDKKLGTLSGGTRQKISACVAFMFNPEIVILDEPTSGLDPLSSEILKEKILVERQKGKLILITSHIMQDLEDTVNMVAYMMDGQLAFYDSLTALKDQTNQVSLNKAVAHLLRQKSNSPS